MPEKVTGKTVNDKLARSFVTLTANLDRLSASENLVVQGILKDLEIEIVKKLQNNPDMTSWRKSRYNALLDQTRDTIKANYEKVADQHEDFMASTAGVIGKASAGIFSSVGVPLQSVVVTPEQWAAIARASLVNGAPNRAWWAKQSQNLQDAFLQQMRIGYASGETIQQLVQRVRGTPTGKKNNYEINGKTHVYTEFQGGIMDTGTRQATALVRTSVQQIAADAKLEMFRKNADILKGVMWLSTLDNRTTPLCRSRDGLLYDLDGNPIGGNKLSFLGGPPAHWNCRSTLVPVTKSFEELGGTPGITKEYLDEIGEGTRASMNGQVPADLTFDSWFRTLPEQDQIAFLGPKKYEIWKKAGLNFADMVDQRGNPLTLVQLAEAYGLKIKQSMESGIPNIPKKMVSAIAVEQQAQTLASEMAKQAADKAAQESAAHAQQEIDKISKSKNVFIQPVWEAYGDQLDGTPEENLAFLTEHIKQEKSAQMGWKKLEKKIEESLKEADSPKLFTEYMEQKTAMEQVKGIALPTQKMAAYKNALAQLKDTNKKIKEEMYDEIMMNSPYLEDLFKDFKNSLKEQGQKPPSWNMQQYRSMFNAYVQKSEKQAADVLFAVPDDPIKAALHSKALEKAIQDIDSSITGSLSKTLEEYNKAVAALEKQEKQAFDDALAKGTWEKSTAIIPPTSNAVPKPGELQISQMEKYGEQKGSNEGGFYRDLRTGTEYYVKFPASEDIARNELLAAKLYEAAGVEVPELTLLKDGSRVGIASKIKAGLTGGTAGELAKAIGSGNGYAVDAWLANWDVVGLGYDNLLLTEAGTAFRVDVGGSLRYRAQGGLKGKAFGDIVTELESLRDPKVNAQSAVVFKNLTKEDLEAGVRKVLELSDDRIRDLVKEYGPRDEATARELADTLIARKNYLAKQFPHLTKPVIEPLPEDVKLLVGDADMVGIKNGRINGFAIPADTDKIEDQSILAWFEKDEEGKEYTGLCFKYTQEAAKIIEEKLGDVGVEETDPQRKALQGQFDEFKSKLHFQWNVSHNKMGQEINKELVAENIKALKKSYEDFIEGMKSYDPSFSVVFMKAFDESIKDIEKSLKQETFNPLGVIASGKFQTSELFNFAFTPAAKSREPSGSQVEEADLIFKEKAGLFYKKNIKDGHAITTNKPLVGQNMQAGEWEHVYEAMTPMGVRIRIWAGERIGGRALENQIEILAPGASKKVVNETIQLIEEKLGISVAPPKEEEQAEMYLRMIARHRGDWDLLDKADEMKKEGSNAHEIHDFLKQRLSEKLGRDITKEAGYAPSGVREAFDSGFRRWYLPGIDTDKDWKDFTKNYVLHHEVTASSSIADALDSILNSGGKMVPTANRLRYGIPWGGMSPGSDMQSGGADYFFTRIFHKRNEGASKKGFIWDARQAGRLDCISYSGDKFGRTTGDFIRENSEHGIEGYKKAAKIWNNELIFKGGMSLFDQLKYINCRDRKEANQVLQVLTKHGWDKTWVDGREITDVIRILDEE